MNCKSCNTPISSGRTSCPACGRHSNVSSFIDEPGESGSSEIEKKPPTLSPSSVVDPVEKNGAGNRPKKKRSPARKRKATEGSTREPATAPIHELNDVVPNRNERTANQPLEIDPMMVRALVLDQPELIEPGLLPLMDDVGREVGIRYRTDVGTIDLLARDSVGAFVVVTLPEAGCESSLVADVLHRIGWVRKHLVKAGERVRGIVLVAELDDDLAYAAAAVSDTIDFKRYAVSVSLTDLEV